MLVLLICLSVSIIVSVVGVIVIRVADRSLGSKKETKAIFAKKDEGYSYRDIDTPEDFFEYVKDALPKDKGLIYSLKSEIYACKSGNHPNIWRDGDHLIRVSIIDPMTDKKIGRFTMNQGQEQRHDAYATVKRDVIQKTNNVIKEWNLKKFAGHEEIVS